MVLRYIRENKGKSLFIAGIVLMWVLLLVLFKVIGYENTWQLWGVPTELPPFLDFRLIPGSAESFRRGVEPTIRNPGDPSGRIFNYPFIWRLFFYTNITQEDTIWIAVTMLVMFFVSVILIPQRPTILGALLTLLVVFSPASMLLYERGNADLIVFFICAMIVLAVDRSAILTAGLIVFGGIVKMFPMLGLTVLLKEPRRRFWILTVTSVVIMVVYSLLTFKSQSAAWNTTMRGDGASYGSFVLITRLGDNLQELLPGLTRGQWSLVFEFLALVFILLPAILAVRRSDWLGTIQERNLTAFRMGASIYVGTFLLGNNWDYRLAFLIFVIPQLSEWMFDKNKRYRFISVGVLALILLSCWHFLVQFDFPFIPLKDPTNRKFIVDELINWLLLMGLAYLLTVSIPDWFRQDLQKLVGINKRNPV